ncbi:SET domain-containing protein [Flavobacterium silvaticum]|uniref:SET domain-containing protein n=1 Tax=Flavobacterium silvaticum TaxID=1852020 RepID=A0A972G0K7_9FLAO|nr:SET domain-containing protein [Flavobacterium silvaticum]NMH28236.1 SET domain-containing protein [Flavobacterium silvaticum]
MIHPDTELRFISDTIGYGVVAKKFIPKGTITWVQDDLDRIFTPQDESQISDRMKVYLETYCFTNHDGNKVLCWDNAKYVNHSFRPSCMSTAYDFEIAIRDIYPGEELTDDYGYLNVEEPFAAADENTFRKVVYPDDLIRHYEEWDELIRQNLNNINTVSQSLKAFIPKETWKEFQSVIDGEIPLRSLLHCYFDRSA